MPLNLGTREVEQIYYGNDTDQTCIAYQGTSQDPFFFREGMGTPTSLWTSGDLALHARDSTDSSFALTASSSPNAIAFPRNLLTGTRSDLTYRVYRVSLTREKQAFGTTAIGDMVILVEVRGYTSSGTRSSAPSGFSSLWDGGLVVRIAGTDYTLPGPRSPNVTFYGIDQGWAVSVADVPDGFAAALNTLVQNRFTNPDTFSVTAFSSSVVSAPTIQNYRVEVAGGSNNAMSGGTLTINRADFPRSPRLTATITNATSWDLYRTGTSAAIASGAANTNLSHQETYTSTFRPPSSGWGYNLQADQSALANCGLSLIHI